MFLTMRQSAELLEVKTFCCQSLYLVLENSLYFRFSINGNGVRPRVEKKVVKKGKMFIIPLDFSFFPVSFLFLLPCLIPSLTEVAANCTCRDSPPPPQPRRGHPRRRSLAARATPLPFLSSAARRAFLWGYKPPVPQDGTWAAPSKVTRHVRSKRTSQDFRLYYIL
jgi:hypothetical protein